MGRLGTLNPSFFERLEEVEEVEEEEEELEEVRKLDRYSICVSV